MSLDLLIAASLPIVVTKVQSNHICAHTVITRRANLNLWTFESERVSHVHNTQYNGDARKSSHLHAAAALRRLISDTVFRVNVGFRHLMRTLASRERVQIFRRWADGVRVDQRKVTSLGVCCAC